VQRYEKVESRTKDFNFFYAETEYLRHHDGKVTKKREKCKEKTFFPFAFPCFFVTLASPKLLSTQKSSNKFGFSFVFS